MTVMLMVMVVAMAMAMAMSCRRCLVLSVWCRQACCWLRYKDRVHDGQCMCHTWPCLHATCCIA